MPWTPESVFENESEAIHIAMELIREYEFNLKDIPVPIRLRFYKVFGADGVMFSQSHFINTPVQADAYRTSRPWNDDLESALHQVVSGITEFYKEAVQKGHTPDESWLEPNDYF